MFVSDEVLSVFNLLFSSQLRVQGEAQERAGSRSAERAGVLQHRVRYTTPPDCDHDNHDHDHDNKDEDRRPGHEQDCVTM